MKTDELLRSYFAGLFDGEGWYTINQQPPGTNRNIRGAMQVHAGMVLRQKRILDLLQECYGGTVVPVVPIDPLKHAPYWKWRITGMGVLRFAREVGRLMMIKGNQSRVAVHFQRTKNRHGNRPWTDEAWLELENARSAMMQMNRKGPLLD